MKKVLAAMCLAFALAQASGPIGTFALLDKVTFEPNADQPERIQLYGVFITASTPPGCGAPSNPCATSYSGPQRGYIYCSLPNGNADLALREWADLKSVAGTRQVVGFGSGWHPDGIRVYKKDEKGQPVGWPLNNGVVRVNADRPEAKSLLEYKEQ